MLTVFTTAKPFREHSGIIQRNALKSWTMLHPRVEVILFGDKEGAEEVVRTVAVLVLAGVLCWLAPGAACAGSTGGTGGATSCRHDAAE